ncbi:hypothetical protein E3Q18_00501 [Wallemia mellicola]|uniref:Integral membrane protein, Mpv17/PMP22 family n=1 Tax=Wallemia mellicola TaxID=1708541 RepID=A0A4T0NZG5_9BASI|nr:hypothetical protein E3Q24_02093 [Wallemia mellicola]TIB88738.1 hypothetical protein E3Q21_00841 [Wallemia mellicola]TIB91369.1 hypothetical protein E3Q20_00827 [Wallemia mellicola]TIC01897.1 hypothetical protein E3Q18_00501 [Wallemia mellicola]TIC03072.1 hypothetical protein E3Q17_01041 [Wallemia mellicola]
MAAFAKAYQPSLLTIQSSFNRRPNITLSLTNGTLSALADSIAQSINPELDENSEKLWNKRRTVNFFIFGAAMGTPLNYWNKFLERAFPLRRAGALPNSPISLRMLFTRVGVDQAVMAPSGLTAFIGIIGILEGKTSRDLKNKYSDLFVPAILANWKVWPLIQLFNFRFCPLAFRVPFTASCGVLWTLYLSNLNSKKGPTEVPAPVTNEKTPTKHQWEQKPTGVYSKAELVGVAR